MGKTIVLICALFGFLAVANAAEYWVVFANYDPGNLDPDGTQGVFLMKIDGQGHVLIPVHSIWPVPFWEGVPSITDGANNQLLIMGLIRPTQASNIEIQALVVDKNTLRSRVVSEFPMKYTPAFSIQTTQNVLPKLLAIAPGPFSFSAFPFDSSGVFDGRSWELVEGIRDPFVDQNGISADGRMAWVEILGVPDTLFVQPLDRHGHPVGTSARVIAHARGDFNFFGGADITNPLPGSARLMAYRDRDAGFIYLQRINADTGERVGVRKKIRAGTFCVQSQALDPDGHFIVYHYPDKNHCNHLVFQSLDASGAPVGASTTLVKCGGIPSIVCTVDILKDGQ